MAKTIEVVEFVPFEGVVMYVSKKEKGTALYFQSETGRFGVYCPGELAGSVKVGDRVVVTFDVGRYGQTARELRNGAAK